MCDVQIIHKRPRRLAVAACFGLALAACSTPENGETSFSQETIARYPTLQIARPDPLTPEAQASERVQASKSTPKQSPKTGNLYLGSDLATAANLTPAFERAASGDGIVLNFDAVDLPTLSEAILGDILNVPYAVDPRVSGVVNLKSTQPVPRDSLVGLFEVLLKSNGAALVIQDQLHRVVSGKFGTRLGSGAILRRPRTDNTPWLLRAGGSSGPCGCTRGEGNSKATDAAGGPGGS